MLPHRRTVILAALLVAAGSLVFTTGAAVINDDADTLAEDRLVVQPAEGPNGKYAYLNEDSEIVVDISPTNPNLSADFEGVNPDTLASADGIFTITYTADEFARVWIDHAGENVTFVAGGNSIEGEANNVTLAPNETVAVGLRIDTRGEVAGTQLGADEFSIRAEVADPEDVSGSGPESASESSDAESRESRSMSVVAPSPDRRQFAVTDTTPGEDVVFEAEGMEMDGGRVTMDQLELTNVPGGTLEMNAVGSPDAPDEASALDTSTEPRPLSYLSLEHSFESEAVDRMTLRFSADRGYLDSADIDPANVVLYRQTDAGSWERLPTDALDEATVRERGLPGDRVHFRAHTDDFSTFAVAAETPRLGVTDAAVGATTVAPGESVTVRTTVTNGGGAAGERTVTLTADNDTIASRRVALDPGASTTVELTGRVETTGEIALAVDGVRVGTLRVEQPEAEAEPTTDASVEQPDTGVEPTTDTDGERPDAGVEPTTDTDVEQPDDPVVEPGGFDLGNLGGLALFLAIALATVVLVRRMPRQ